MNPMTSLHLDYETFSSTDLKLRGLMNYARGPGTRVLMCAYAFDDGPVKLWVALDPMPVDLRQALTDPDVMKIAWNAQFEMAITEDVLHIPVDPRQWQCAMVKALLLALPAALDKCGEVVGLPAGKAKMSEGKRLIQLFCKPHNGVQNDAVSHPDKWSLFCEYCRQDVVAERSLWKRLSKFYTPDREWDLWRYDLEINRRGLPVDLQFINAAIAMADGERERLREELTELTGLRNPNSGTQLHPWLAARGYPFAGLRAERIKIALRDFSPDSPRPELPVPEILASLTAEEADKLVTRHRDWRPMTQEAVEALRLRLTMNKTSLKKYDAMLRFQHEGRLHYGYQFAGAGRTLRWAGRGAQMQNPPRPAKHLEDHIDFIRDCILEGDAETIQAFFGDVMLCLSSCIRAAIKAPPGKRFIVSDLSSIESRVIGWLTRCETLLNVFREGKCAYKLFASWMFEIAYDQVTKAQRNQAKPPTLGGGFGLSGGEEVGEYPDVQRTGLWAYGETMGIDLGRLLAHRCVEIFRSRFVEIVEFWNDVQTAAFHTTQTGEPSEAGRIKFDICKPFLRARLPSGRFIYYLRPRIEPRKVVVGKIKVTWNGVDTWADKVIIRKNLTYEGYVQGKSKVWGRVATHPGKLTENFVQALARDGLAVWMLAARDAGYEVCGDTHDELITEDDEDGLLSHENLSSLASVVGNLLPGMPVGAEGYEARVYRK